MKKIVLVGQFHQNNLEDLSRELKKVLTPDEFSCFEFAGSFGALLGLIEGHRSAEEQLMIVTGGVYHDETVTDPGAVYAALKPKCPDAWIGLLTTVVWSIPYLKGYDRVFFHLAPESKENRTIPEIAQLIAEQYRS